MLAVPIKLAFILCAALWAPADSNAVVATPAESGAPLFDYRQVVLDNGLRVITLEDFSCPIVNVQVWYSAGSKDEQPDRRGFAHMFEHMMFRGTDRLGPMDHADRIGPERLYQFRSSRQKLPAGGGQSCLFASSEVKEK